MLPPEYEDALKVCPTLIEQVSAASDMTLEEEYQLLVKVRIARQIFADRLKLWAQNRSDLDEDAAKNAMASVHLQEAVKDYIDTIAKIAAVSKTMSDHVSVHSVFAVFKQVERILDRELNRHMESEAAEIIKRVIRNEVRVPGKTDEGETVTPPSRIASFMDATIPTEN